MGIKAYCADVPRWIPRFGRFSQATQGMAFNIKRVIAKDYSTGSATLITLLLAEIYQHVVRTTERDIRHLLTLAGLIALTVLATGFVGRRKKRGVFNENKTP